MKNLHLLFIRLRGFVILALLAFSLAFILSQIFSTIFVIGEARLTDQLFRLRYHLFGKEKINPFLVHIVFDDESLEYFNALPRDSEMYGKIITILKEAGADRIACDIFFQYKSPDEEEDPLLHATGQAGNVYYPLILFDKPLSSSLKSYPSSSAIRIVEDSLWHPVITEKGNPFNAEGILTPFEELMNESQSTGHINCTPDRDGISRRFPLIYSYKTGYIPALTLRMVCDYVKIKPEKIELVFGKYMLLKDAYLPGGSRKDIRIPIDKKGCVIINYAGPWKDSFYTVSAKDLFSVQENELLKVQLKDILENSLVLISDVSVRNKDVGPGIFENLIPGSEILMTLTNMILTENFLTGFGGFLFFLLIMCFSLFSCFFSSVFRFKGFCISIVLAPLLYYSFCLFLFLVLHIVPVMLFPGIGFSLYILFGSVYLYYDKIKEADKLRHAVATERKRRQELEENEKSTKSALKKLLGDFKISFMKKTDLKYSKGMLKNADAFKDIKTINEKMIKVFYNIELLTPGLKPILILGETGTGKEIIASVINSLSSRTGKYIRINIAGEKEDFINDSLFGHVKHSFTGAETKRDGFIKTAEKGCIFLDEIGELSLAVQVKLLRLIENKEYSPVGSDEIIKADVKIIAATNVDLDKKIEKGTFRRDLAERFGLKIKIPPLRERPDDLPLLLNHFIQKSAEERKKDSILNTIKSNKQPYPKQLLDLLKNYSFPGNIRELESMVDEAVAQSTGDILSLDIFSERILKEKINPREMVIFDAKGNKKSFAFNNNLDELLNQITEHFIDKALEDSNQNQTKASKLLGISRDKIKRYVKKRMNL